MLNKNYKTDIPKIFTIHRVLQEADHTKTIFLKTKINLKPGQFVMLWIPGVDEKPYAISYYKKDEFGITSHSIGKFSQAFDKLKKGDKVGIRGPYGNGFTIKNSGKNACIVTGGIGISSVSTLIDILKKPAIIAGFRTKNMIIYAKRYKNMNIATDDGSYGYKGFVTELFKQEINKNKFSVVYTCGPEIMMKKVLEICNQHHIECQASVERFMKCSFGICGACMINDRVVCIDGSIFNSAQLNKFSEFGKYARIKTGKKVTLKEYCLWRS